MLWNFCSITCMCSQNTLIKQSFSILRVCCTKVIVNLKRALLYSISEFTGHFSSCMITYQGVYIYRSCVWYMRCSWKAINTMMWLILLSHNATLTHDWQSEIVPNTLQSCLGRVGGGRALKGTLDLPSKRLGKMEVL